MSCKLTLCIIYDINNGFHVEVRPVNPEWATSDVCLISRGSVEAAEVLPRPCLGLDDNGPAISRKSPAKMPYPHHCEQQSCSIGKTLCQMSSYARGYSEVWYYSHSLLYPHVKNSSKTSVVYSCLWALWCSGQHIRLWFHRSWVRLHNIYKRWLLSFNGCEPNINITNSIFKSKHIILAQIY